MPRKGHVPKRTVEPDPIYGSDLVTKFVNSMMWGGKKSTAQSIFYDSMKNLETRGGEDYLEQLRYLGAIIAVPSGPRPGDYQFCDLSKQPSRFVEGDLAAIQRISWTDDNPASVRSLMAALGARGNPSHFIAFMPLELEAKLFQRELAFQGLREDQIFETKFKCVRGPGGKYDVRVIDQKRK